MVESAIYELFNAMKRYKRYMMDMIDYMTKPILIKTKSLNKLWELSIVDRASVFDHVIYEVIIS